MVDGSDIGAAEAEVLDPPVEVSSDVGGWGQEARLRRSTEVVDPLCTGPRPGEVEANVVWLPPQAVVHRENC